MSVKPTKVERVADWRRRNPGCRKAESARAIAERQAAGYYQKYWSKPVARMSLLVSNAFSRARKRGIECEGRLRDLLKNDPPANCLCCDKMLDYRMGRGRADGARADSPSLDRLDPLEGYTVANVRVVCFRCNMVKNAASLDELRLLVAYVERELPTVKAVSG